MLPENLDTLRAQAREEMELFHLPPDWRVGREAVHGFTVDKPGTRTIDDALHLTPEGDNAYTITLSIADVASFLSQPSALRTLAQMRGRNVATQGGQAISMWPNIISKNLLSLRKGEERPVIATHLSVDAEGNLGQLRLAKGVIRAKEYDSSTVDAWIWEPDQAHEEQVAASSLFRLAWLMRRQDERGSPKDPRGHREPSSFMTSQITHAAGVAVAEYAVQHQIPVIHRFSPKPNAPAEYATQAPKGRRFVRTASPLRRFIDFVNQANIVAHLEGEPFPFPAEELEEMTEHYTQRLRQRNELTPGALSAIRDRIISDEASNRDIARVLLAPDTLPGSMDARLEAFDLIIEEPQMAHGIVRYLIAQRKLQHRRAKPTDKLPTKKVYQDAAGNVYPDTHDAPQGESAMPVAYRQMRADIMMLIKIAGVDAADLEMPWYLTKDAEEIFRAPARLKKMRRTYPIAISYDRVRTDDKNVTQSITVVRNGDEYTYEATDASRDLALCSAAFEAVKDNADLLPGELPRNIDPKSELGSARLMKRLGGKAMHPARFYLKSYLQQKLRTGDVQPEFVLQEEADDKGRKLYICTVTCPTVDGKVYTAAAKHENKIDAQDIAALRVLRAANAPILTELDALVATYVAPGNQG